MKYMHNSKISKWFIFAGLMFNFNFCFAEFQDHLGIYMKIPKNVCDKVVYIDQDDGSTGTIPASNGNYDLRSRHDFEHSSQGNYKKRDYICYSRGKGAAFNFSQIAGYWQHVDTQVVLGSNAIDGRANIFVDGVKIPCGNDDETKHYWRVYWNSTVGPGGMSKCPNSKVYCIDAGYLHLCSNNGFKSDAPSDVSVHANWKRIYFQGIESGHSASTTTHYYINMNITHVDTSANPTLTDSLLLISPPMFGGQIYDAAGVPFLPTATNILSSQDGSWYRAAKPNYYDDISLKLQIGLSKDAQDQLLKDGTYTCSALVKSKNDPHTISIHNVIIKKSYSYLNKSIAIDASHQNYKFLDAGTHSFYGDKKSINLELTVTCQNGHKDQDINFYPQKIQLYKVKHFRDY